MKIFRAVFFLFVLMGCRHEPIEPIVPEDPTYTMRFVFVNRSNSGFGDVHAVKLISRSYKVNADSSFVYMTTYADPDSFDPPPGTELKDSIVHFSKNNYSPGSKKWFSVQVQFYDFGLPFGQTHYRTQIFELDSNWVFCNEPEDFTEKFVWPEDTLRYIKTFDEFFN
jgi:hypothetical protein